MALLLLGLLWLPSSAAPAPTPSPAVNVTVYHTTPEPYGALPLDQDTADFLGHIFFSVTATFTQASCKLNSSSWWCENPEVFTPPEHLVITELVLEVDPRFGPYGKCNVCVHGRDPFGSHRSCVPGRYVCNCLPGLTVGRRSAARGPGQPPDPAEFCGSAVGHENVGTDFVPPCDAGSSQDDCWYHNMAQKIGGNWYSTFAKGHCRAVGSSQCTWRVVEVVQRIRKRCADNIIYAGIEEKNGPCFQQCGPRRDVASVCWQQCFMAAVVGPRAGHAPDPSGLPLGLLEALWRRPLRAEGAGGCPKLPVPRGAVHGPALWPPSEPA